MFGEYNLINSVLQIAAGSPGMLTIFGEGLFKRGRVHVVVVKEVLEALRTLFVVSRSTSLMSQENCSPGIGINHDHAVLVDVEVLLDVLVSGLLIC